MGLSSKQVINRDGLDWSAQALLQSHDRSVLTKKNPQTTMRRQQQHQNQAPSEPLNCPRCDSTNTKFCYYNNYNKSQPRHFCRACKRHWTKGGTLRNVPVGGCRKNKRSKKSSSATTLTTTATSASAAAAGGGGGGSILENSHVAFQANNQPMIIKNSIDNIIPNISSCDDHDERSMSEILYQAMMIRPPPLSLSSSFTVQNGLNLGSELDKSSTVFSTSTSSSLAFPQTLQFSAGLISSTSSPFDSSLSSISSSFQMTPSIGCDYGEDQAQMITGDQSSTVVTPIAQPPWQQLVSNGMDMPSYQWNFEDIDTLASADHVNLPWDESLDIKP